MKRLTQHKIDKNESVITISGLYKSFGDLQVLKGIDFNLYKGENVAVLGKSGTGKSVLIKINIELTLQAICGTYIESIINQKKFITK